MALTSCRECGAKVSTQAEACPKCGAPQRGTVTTQQTAKRYKGAQLAGAAMLVIGLFAMFNGGLSWGSLLTLLGLVVFIGARFLAWWNHG